MASSKSKVSKNQYRRAQKKARKLQTQQQANGDATPAEVPDDEAADGAQATQELLTVQEADGDAAMTEEPQWDNEFNDPNNPYYEMYQQIAKRFMPASTETAEEEEEDADGPEIFYSDDDDMIPEEDEVPKLSKKQRRRLNRPTVAQLKMVAKNPESVQWWDVDAPDPWLHLRIKEMKNIVPVPDHWNVKREYLSSKRGIEKPQFQLPKFIADTGIAEMRDAQLEKEAEKTLKQKQRDRVQPKMGKLDLDYQRMYEAFFKHQTKPHLSKFGEVYYEGKELEAKQIKIKPGIMSEALKEALGMPVGAPLPWLLTMQKIGPPPAFPTMEIPGLNAPIPPGASWGYAPGQFGKPTLDEYNRPMWGGDVFGVYKEPQDYKNPADDIDKSYWGIVQRERYEDAEEEESDQGGDEEEEEEEEDVEMSPPPQPEKSQFKDVSGEQLRAKPQWKINPEAPEHSGSLYQVLGEQETRIEGFMGSTKRYDLKNPSMPILGEDEVDSANPGHQDVSVDVDALERDDGLSREEISRQYEASREQETVSVPHIIPASPRDDPTLGYLRLPRGRHKVGKPRSGRRRS